MPFPRSLSGFELGYVVGLFEGEGHISLNESHRNDPKRTVCYSVHIGITNTNRALLEKAKEIIGIGVVRSHHQPNKNNKDCFIWHLGDQKSVLWFLNQVYPYLIEKKEKATLLIPFLESRIACNPHKKASRDRKYSEKEHQIFEEYKKLSSYHKARGVRNSIS